MPALSVAAALAVLLCAGCRSESAPPTAVPAPSPTTATVATPTTTPSSAPSPVATPGPPEQVLDAAALPTGAPPRVPYAFAHHPTFGGGGWMLVRPDGSTTPFGHDPSVFMAYEDVSVNGYGTEGGFVVELRYGDEPVKEVSGLCHFTLATTPDRDRVGWLEEDSLVTLSSDGSVDTRPVTLPGGPCGNDNPVALVDTSLYLAAKATTAVVGPHRTTRLAALRELVDVSAAGDIAGRFTDDPSCWGLLREGAGPSWRTCTDRLVSFAPDGRHVVGTIGEVDLAAFGGIVVHRSRDGRVDAQWGNAAGQRVTQVDWEDAGHLLVVVRNAAVGWSVVRLGLDGSAEYAVAPVRTGPEFPPFRLEMD